MASILSKSASDELLYQYGKIRKWIPFAQNRHIAYFLYITGACNLDCTYCWQREQEKAVGDFTDSSRAPLKPHEWVRVVNGLPRPSVVGLSGGEATLSPAFAPIVQAAKGRHAVTVNTNATHLTDAALEAITEPHVRNISVSIDGFRSVHDASRNGAGLFDKTCANIQLIRRTGLEKNKRPPEITVKTVLSDETIDDLLAFRDFCANQLGARTLNISLQKMGDHHQYSLLHHPDHNVAFGGKAELYPYKRVEDIVRILGGALDDLSHPCRIVLYPRIPNASTLRKFFDEKGDDVYAPCHLPRALATILPDGQVIPCQSLALGNVRDYDWKVTKVMAQQPARQFDAMLTKFGRRLPPSCRVCCFSKVDSSK